MLTSSFRSLRHRNFRLYIAGQAVSVAGSWMQGVAQSWLVYRLTHSELLLGTTLFCTHIPVLLLGPVAGVVVDRYPRRGLVVVTQTLAMVQALLLCILTLTGAVTTTHVLVLAVMLGIGNAFDIPGRQSLFVHLVGKDDLISAVSLNSAVFNFARIIGPPIGGFVVALVGEGYCFAINALSFLAVIGALLAMDRLPAEPEQHESALQQLKDGLRYAHSESNLRLILGISGILNLSFAPGMVLAPFFADAIFHKGSIGLGYLTGAMGIGAVAGVLRLAAHKGIRRLPKVTLYSAMFMGISLLAFGLAPAYWVALLAMALLGFSIMRQNAAGNSVIQSVVPDLFRGRIMALYSMMVTGFYPIGSLAGGALAHRFGARAAVVVGGALCLAAAAVFRLFLGQFQAWVDDKEQKTLAEVTA